MFEITKDQLRHLSDVQLRELIARLCEAELGMAGAPVSAVRWAGAHTAPDGGLDVDCSIDDHNFRGDFVPRPRTGFQVKKPTMPPAKIASEMSPKGQLRPIFADLAASNGCYVIVSLDDDPVGDAATQRRNAMRSQLDAVRAREDVRTDFYGRAELANWLRQHPAVQLWARDVLGIPLDGWKPFGRWTNVPPGDNDELICKPGVSIVLPGKDTKKLDVAQGIEEIRNLVRTSDKALRIVGLSGVGKSRIVQALFEASVGDEPLHRRLAIYADLGTEPVPSSRQMLARLQAEGRSAILVLDNCPADTHNLLAGQASSAPDIRLITIEYDIRDDKPELTIVIRINAECIEVVEALVSRRFPGLGQVNSRTIAEYSGGNARLALALADAVDEEENLSDFSNAQFFDRLFHQRDALDPNLLAAAQALALVYSYSVNADEDGVDELATLAGLVGQNRLSLYRATQTLLERQLAQKRGNWRAILPPALSNHLATKALDNIPTDDIRNTLEILVNTRLLKSFAKRLGYLHDHDVARQIVGSWLSPGGLLHAVESLDDDRMQLFSSVAPVSPSLALAAIEARASQPEYQQSITESEHRARTIALLLCAIAYDAELFERCVNLLVPLAIDAAHDNHPQSDVPGRLSGLFALYLSATEAGLDTRERTIRRFLFSVHKDERKAGLAMLETALKSGHWASFASTFEFGARPRSFGYHPPTQQEHDRWFLRFILVACEAATHADAELSDHARELLAGELRELWQNPALRPVLKTSAAALHDHRSWPEGWRAIRSIKYFDYRTVQGQEMPDGIDLLDELDDLLRPAKLSDEVRTYVCDVGHRHFSLLDEFDLDDQTNSKESHRRAAVRAHDLGVATCNHPEVLDEISQHLFTSESDFVMDFGQGLATACVDPRVLWDRLVGYLQIAGDRTGHCLVLRGALNAIYKRDEVLARTILRETATNRMLRRFIVSLHLSAPMSRETISVFDRALEFDDTPLDQFAQLAWQRPPGALTEALLNDLFSVLLGRPHGAQVILTGLSMRIRALKDDEFVFGADLKRLGLLASAAMLRDSPHYYGGSGDHHLSRVLGHCLDEAQFPQETAEVTDAFLTRVKNTYGNMGGLHGATAVIAERVPLRLLDGVFLDPALEPYHSRELFTERRHRANGLVGVGTATLMEWCRQGDFQARLTKLSRAIHPFAGETKGDGVTFSKQAHAIIDSTQDPAIVLGHFANPRHLSVWSGSLADIIARRRHPFELLLEHERADIRNAAERLIPQIKDAEDREREQERAEDQERDQRFE